ncbi:MAG: hypothetical protein Kow0049_07750 [Stanieria sp.]
MKQLSTVRRWIATSLFCLFAIALVWQGGFFLNTAAMANPVTNLIATKDAGDVVQDKAFDLVKVS